MIGLGHSAFLYHDFFLMLHRSEVSGDREVQRTMLELLNQLDGFSSDERIKVCCPLLFLHALVSYLCNQENYMKYAVVGLCIQLLDPFLFLVRILEAKLLSSSLL